MKLTTFAASVLIVSLVTLLPQASAQDAESSAVKTPVSSADAGRLSRLESMLESIRQDLKIPAMSAAIVKDQKVMWAKGFGYADLEARIPATEHTAYHLASLTKTFASTILMQLVQEGKIKLDDPVSKYGVTLESEGVIRVRHLFSHTSEGNPGERYSYNGNRFAELDKVVQKATGKSFAEVLIANILDPLGMDETAPNVAPTVKLNSPAGADQKSADEVKAALTDLIAGFNSANAEQIDRNLAPQAAAFRSNGGYLAEVLSPDTRDAFRSGFKVNLQVNNLETAVYGDTAITTHILTGVVTPPGGPARPDGPWRATFVWNKQGGAWKVVHAHQSALGTSFVTEKHQRRFDAVSKILARPYALDKSFNPVKIQYPTSFSVSAGLISTVLDMAKYDIAIDQNRLLTRETQQLAFTPAVSTKGETLPYGLGWFTQNYKGTRMIWHYGYWMANSSLILKVPERNITFIAMANTDNLSRPTDLGTGDVTSSPVALAFLKTFIFPEMFREALPEINWKATGDELKDQMMKLASGPYAELSKKELVNHYRMLASVGKTDDAARLTRVYAEMYSKKLPEDLAKKPVIAQIIRVADDQDQTVEFSLSRAQRVRVFAIGEGQGGQMFDYGWIEDAQTGKPVWQMKEPETRHAGGAGKNRSVDTVVELPAGKYKLRYKSDDSHSYDHWNSFPPDVNFWGIALFANE